MSEDASSKLIPAPTLGEGNTNQPTSHAVLPDAGNGRSLVTAIAFKHRSVAVGYSVAVGDQEYTQVGTL